MTNPDNKLGTPLKAEGPEWDTVEQERDYWKKLALSYGAMISAIRHTMGKSWTVELDHQGNAFVVEDDPAGAKSPPLDVGAIREIEADLREQAQGTQDGYLLDACNRLRSIIG